MICTRPVLVNGSSFRCGKCYSCQSATKRDWSLRLLHELQYWKKACFITLTYNSENLPANGSLNIRDYQLFMKRLRKQLDFKIKYYVAGEYGERFGRPHYHMILYGLSMADRELIESCWQLGFVKVDAVTPKSVAYVCKYLEKDMALRGREGRLNYLYVLKKQPPFRRVSKGIGFRWLLDNQFTLRKNLYIKRNGFKLPIPRYYRKFLGLTVHDFPDFIKQKMRFLKQFFFEHELSKPHLEHYKKYGLTSPWTFPSVVKRFKEYLLALEKDWESRRFARTGQVVFRT